MSDTLYCPNPDCTEYEVLKDNSLGLTDVTCGECGTPVQDGTPTPLAERED